MLLCYVAYSPLDLQSANSIQTFNTVRELSVQLGDDLQVLVPRFGKEAPPPFPVKRLARIPVNKLSRLVPSAWYSYVERMLYAERAKGMIQQLAPSLIYTRDVICAYRFVRAGLPVLYEIHDLESKHPGQHKSARLKVWLERGDETTLRGARGLVSLTETFRQELLARNWQPAARIFVIPDAYDASIYFPRDKLASRDSLQLPRDAKIVTYAGLTFKYRGLEVLLRAFQQWNEPDARLVLVGGRDFEVRELQALAQQLQIAAKIVWAGRQSPNMTAAYLAAADVLVIPDTVTDATASPLKMFEYMAMARPIVCVDRAALREILGDAAFYFPRGDHSALANALCEAIQPEANRMGERAHERAAEFTYAKRAEKIIRAAKAVANA
ncbi:MAG TPA: glycosyltransferase [Anaerolineae bacterium]|nr:glycosyltransferase [Anaerolineae bacterium]